jgi:hypothetical protein
MSKTGAVRYEGIQSVSYTAGEAFTTRYAFAKLPAAEDTVNLADEATDEIIGVAQREAAVGEEVAVKTMGYSLITCGETIAIGDYLRPGTDGKAFVADATGDLKVARALQAGAAGDKIECVIVSPAIAVA